MNKKMQICLILNQFFLIAFNLEEQKNPYSHFLFNAGCKFITQRIFFDFQVLHCLEQISRFFVLEIFSKFFMRCVFQSSVFRFLQDNG